MFVFFIIPWDRVMRVKVRVMRLKIKMVGRRAGWREGRRFGFEVD